MAEILNPHTTLTKCPFCHEQDSYLEIHYGVMDMDIMEIMNILLGVTMMSVM